MEDHGKQPKDGPLSEHDDDCICLQCGHKRWVRDNQEARERTAIGWDGKQFDYKPRDYRMWEECHHHYCQEFRGCWVCCHCGHIELKPPT